VGTSKALGISLDEQILIEKKLRKFAEQQLEEKDKKIMSLEIGNTLDANHYWAKGFENQFQQLPKNGWYVFKKPKLK